MDLPRQGCDRMAPAKLCRAWSQFAQGLVVVVVEELCASAGGTIASPKANTKDGQGLPWSSLCPPRPRRPRSIHSSTRSMGRRDFAFRGK